MMKWVMYLVLAVLAGGSLVMYSHKGSETTAIKQRIDRLEEAGDPEGKVPKLMTELQSKEGEKTFNGILLTFLGAGVVGIFFVVTVLPFFAQRLTDSVYSSAEELEKDAMRDARSLIAQGDFDGAIEALKQAAIADPTNRLPWIEIVKLQKDQLADPAAAMQTLRDALESQPWEVDDAAYFLFRLADLYEAEGDHASAMVIMNQVIGEFPATRHSANATHKLKEWELTAGAAATAADEAKYLARMQRETLSEPRA